jgi:hypothetical protein
MDSVQSFQFGVLLLGLLQLIHHFVVTVFDLGVGTAELDRLHLHLLVLLTDLALQHSVIDRQFSVLLMGHVVILL